MKFSRTAAAFSLLLVTSSCLKPSLDERLKARAKMQRHAIQKVVDGEPRAIRCGASHDEHAIGDGLFCEVDLKAPIPAEIGPELCPADVEIQTIFAAVRGDLIEADWVRMRGCGVGSDGKSGGYSIKWSKKDGWLLNTRSWGLACSK